MLNSFPFRPSLTILLQGARHMVHISLSKVEGAYEAYEGILSSNPFQSEFRAFEVCLS
jgi:hypothetical protein